MRSLSPTCGYRTSGRSRKIRERIGGTFVAQFAHSVQSPQRVEYLEVDEMRHVQVSVIR